MFNLFSSGKNQEEKSARPDLAHDKLIQGVLDRINREDLVNSFFREYEEGAKKNDWRPFYNHLYLGLEKFVAENEPPVVKERYTIEGLRRSLLENIGELAIPQMARPLFFDAVRQAKFVYETNLAKVFNFVVDNLGRDQLNHWMAEIVRLGVAVEEGSSGWGLVIDATMSIQEVTAIYRSVFLKLYQEIGRVFGKKRVDEIYTKLYDETRTFYDYRMLSLLLDVLPTELTVEGKFSVLSREELEGAIIERTRELDEAKVQLLEKVRKSEEQNRLLGEDKVAMQNLLEDARDLEGKLKDERDRAVALNSQLQTFRLAVESASNHIIITDVEGKIQYANPAVTRITGYSQAEVIDQNPRLWGGLMGQPFYENLWRTIKTEKKPYQGDVRNRRKDGKEYDARITVSPLLKDGGELLGFVGVEEDITDRINFEKELQKQKHEVDVQVNIRTRELQEEKAKLVAAINAIRRGFVMIDKNGKVLLSNRTVSDIFESEEREWSIEELDKILGGVFGVRESFETSITMDQGLEKKGVAWDGKYLDFLMLPVFTLESKTLIGVLFLIDDVTEIKLLERSKDEFFSIASHELRTPLTAIKGNSSMIIDHFGDKLTDPNLREMVDDIHESSGRLIKIVNDFLDMSRLELGKIEFKKEALSVVELVERVVKEYQSNVELKNLYLRFEPVNGEVPMIYADRDKVEQVLVNLIGNAVKFTEKGGVTIGLSTQDGMVKILVTDTGLGLSNESQQLLFRKFQQAGESIYTRDASQGTGLGLYISRLIVEGMGGKIRLEKSEVGAGSIFSLTLPVAKMTD